MKIEKKKPKSKIQETVLIQGKEYYTKNMREATKLNEWEAYKTRKDKSVKTKWYEPRFDYKKRLQYKIEFRFSKTTSEWCSGGWENDISVGSYYVEAGNYEHTENVYKDLIYDSMEERDVDFKRLSYILKPKVSFGESVKVHCFLSFIERFRLFFYNKIMK